MCSSMFGIAIHALNCSGSYCVATNTEKVLQICSQAKEISILEIDCVFKKETQSNKGEYSVFSQF